MLQVVGNSLGQGNLRGGWCHDLAKQLSYYLYLFSFLFFSLDLLHRRECRKVSHHMTGSHSVMSHDVTYGSYDKYGKVVHRPCSSCISSAENLMGTLLSSSCQMLIKKQLA